MKQTLPRSHLSKKDEWLRKKTSVLYALVLKHTTPLSGMVATTVQLGFTAIACLPKTEPQPICLSLKTQSINAICVCAKNW